jgi:phasin
MNDKMTMQVQGQIKEMAEKSVEQVEKAFTTFIEAAHKTVEMVPLLATEFSKKTLSMSEQNMKAAFDHARRLLQATDLQQFMDLQTEYVKSQWSTMQEQL